VLDAVGGELGSEDYARAQGIDLIDRSDVLPRCEMRKRSNEKEDNPICSDHQIEMAILIAMVLMVIDLKISECWSHGHNSNEPPAGDCDLFA
jgi:hypothetical protein